MLSARMTEKLSIMVLTNQASKINEVVEIEVGSARWEVATRVREETWAGKIRTKKVLHIREALVLTGFSVVHQFEVLTGMKLYWMVLASCRGVP
ncbi:hypothetical protein V6N13_055842 [Hibiscus sabdariffa]